MQGRDLVRLDHAGRIERAEASLIAGESAIAPPCPMLFIYGTKKPFMFHSPQWVEQLARKPDSKVLAMPTGH